MRQQQQEYSEGCDTELELSLVVLCASALIVMTGTILTTLTHTQTDRHQQAPTLVQKEGKTHSQRESSHHHHELSPKVDNE